LCRVQETIQCDLWAHVPCAKVTRVSIVIIGIAFYKDLQGVKRPPIAGPSKLGAARAIELSPVHHHPVCLVCGERCAHTYPLTRGQGSTSHPILLRAASLEASDDSIIKQASSWISNTVII
jgi:hypothetical protein